MVRTQFNLMFLCSPGIVSDLTFFSLLLGKRNLTEFLRCDRPQSCLGVSDQGMKNFSNKTFCAVGYNPKSTLCAVCDVGFYPLGASECAACPDQKVNNVFIFLVSQNCWFSALLRLTDIDLYC